jgi:hypothetical protein
LWTVALGTFLVAGMAASAVFWTTSIREQQVRAEVVERVAEEAEVIQDPAVETPPENVLVEAAAPRVVPASPELPSPSPKLVDRTLVEQTAQRLRAPKPAPPPEVPLDVVMETEQAPAMLRIRSGDLPADIYLNGERIGSTRDPHAMKLPPGTYDLEIRSSHVMPASVRVLLAEGEVLEKEVVLQAKPATVRFDPLLSGDCLVWLDGASLGPLEALGRRVLVRNPSETHTIRVDCATGTREMAYAFVPLETVFPSFE